MYSNDADLAPPHLVDLRTMMGQWPTGVSVVTTCATDGQVHGMTCSSLCSISLQPPIISISLRNESPTLKELLSTGGFAVNLLHEDAHHTAVLFASGRPDRFDHVEWELPHGAWGPHLTGDSLGALDAAVQQSHQIGDHTVVFAGVRATWINSRLPLVHGRQQFGRWSMLVDGSG